MIIQYVRDENRVPIGVVVATAKNEIGVSQCNPKDKFKKDLGVQIAAGRAMNNMYWKVTKEQEDLFRMVVDNVKKRSEKYFQ